MNFHFVDYKWDFASTKHLFKAAYEKCNLHPSYISTDQPEGLKKGATA